MAINKLTQSALRTAKSTQKPYKLSDGGGLYLLVNPNGALWWRFKYQFEGREKLLSLGVYPHVSLQQARALRDEAKKGVANGVDPSAKRQAEKSSTANTFEAVARGSRCKRRSSHPPPTPRRYGLLIPWCIPTSAHVPSPNSALPMCSRFSGASRAEELMKPLTAPVNAVPKYFATPCKPSAPHMT